MNQPFRDQVALITGAGSGIGLAIALQLCQQGAKVVINDLDPVRLETIQREYPAYQIHCMPGDGSCVSLIRNLVAACIKRFGRLDICIANAGRTHFGSFWEVDTEDFDNLMALNLRGSFFLAQAAAKQMRLQGKGGRILLMSSNIGFQPYPNLAAYSMSKAALQMLARSLVGELSPFGITVNALAPGATLTKRTLEDDPDYVAHWQELIPLGKVAQPNDIAEAALFLLSPAAHHITGHTLVIDGGWTQTASFPSSEPLPSHSSLNTSR
ncbi:MAG: SDR family oxidoreductase [Bacteroidota bacterium]